MKVSRCKPSRGFKSGGFTLKNCKPSGGFTPQKGVNPLLSCKRFLKKGENPPGVNPLEGLHLDIFNDPYRTLIFLRLSESRNDT